MQRKYFALKPVKGLVYRRHRRIAFVYVDADIDGNFIGASQLVLGQCESYSTIEETSKAIADLQDKTWVITYDLYKWSCLFEPFINTFLHITGIGIDSQVMELECKDKAISIVDAFQFYATSLQETSDRLLDINIAKMPSEFLPIIVNKIWQFTVDTFKEVFNIYPSKTPGATALKAWRRFIPEKIKARGKISVKFANEAIKPPAMHWSPGIYDNAYLYDINASYPSVMRSLRYPIRYQTFIGAPPPTSRWIALVNLSYKQKEGAQFSPISVQLEKDVRVSPTQIKNANISLTYLDVPTLSMCGNVTINNWIEGIYWRPEDELDLFSKWTNTVEKYSLRDDKIKFALKIVSRALHSKFSQRPWYVHTEIFQATQKTIKQLVRSGKVADLYPLKNGNMAVKKITKKRSHFQPYIHPEWEALTLSLGRYILYSSMDKDTIYMHTDSIISTNERRDLPIGSSFGLWKEKEAGGVAFIAGIGLYVIGETVASSGAKISKRAAFKAIKQAAAGISETVKTFNYPGLLSTAKLGASDFTVSMQKYPKAMVDKNIAFVTRSPTRAIKIIPDKRKLSKTGHERSILKSA